MENYLSFYLQNKLKLKKLIFQGNFLRFLRFSEKFFLEKKLSKFITIFSDISQIISLNDRKYH